MPYFESHQMSEDLSDFILLLSQQINPNHDIIHDNTFPLVFEYIFQFEGRFTREAVMISY